jgi:murein DD-endopeptidase MepM/ murein hydrolase activator NlpD
MLRYCKYLIIFMLLINNAFAQQVKQDTTNINFKDEEDYDIPDTTHSNIHYIPEDMMFVPSGMLYDYQWDNKNIRFRKIVPSEKKDTTLIIFDNSPDNNFYFPIQGKLLSPFGYRGHHFHTGVDIRLKHNDSVYSAMSGKIRIAHRFRGYGNCVVVRHYNGLETVYAHLNQICVKVDDEIKAGDLLGLGGRTGHATADHLHFEIRFLEQPINPLAFMDFDNYNLKTDTLVITANTFTSLSTPPNKPYNRKHKKGKSKQSTTITKNDTSKINSKKKTLISKDDPPTSEEKSSNNHKYYIIKSGDNLYSIAQKNQTTVDKLRQLNGFSKKKILKVGTRIKIE